MKLDNFNKFSFSCVMYCFLLDLYMKQNINYIISLRSNHSQINLDFLVFWYFDIKTSDIYWNYCYLKVFNPEQCLSCFPAQLLFIINHFRILSHKMPIQTERIARISLDKRLCNLCHAFEIGDEFHHIVNILLVLEILIFLTILVKGQTF